MKRLSIVVLPVLLACGTSNTTPMPDAGADSGEYVPPQTCKTPQALPADGWFTEITDEVGLSPTKEFEPVATAIVPGDLDGDGWVDFIASFFPSQREDAGTKHTRFVFMNRPSPDDPSQRVFVDAYEQSGLMATRIDDKNNRGWSGASLADFDNDGDLDVILCPGGADPTQIIDLCDAFLNDGKAHFKLADASGLNAEKFWATGASYLDLDRDGIIDFYPGTSGKWPNGPTIQSAIRLYKGAGDGTFDNVAASVGLPTAKVTSQNGRSNMGVTSCDLDGDGDLDLLTANYGRNPNEVFKNVQGSFSPDSGKELGLAYDDRQDPSDDQSYRCYCQNNPGKCPQNVPAPVPGFCTAFGGINGRGWFPGVSDQPWNLGGNNWALTCTDLDDDGDNDVVTAETRHWDVGNVSDFSEIAYNDGPGIKFRRPGPEKTGMSRDHSDDPQWNEGDNSALVFDIDFDGRKDIYLASSNYPGTHAWIFRQKDDRTFEDVTKRAKGWHASTEGPVAVDIDNDGDLDIIAGSGTFNFAAATNAIHVYRNDIGQNANWTRIKLVGAGAGGSNKQAIGARVKITAGGKSQYQEIHTANAHAATEAVAVFGLGAACTIDSIEVRWPNGALTTKTYKDIRANAIVELREGDDKAHYVKPAK